MAEVLESLHHATLILGAREDAENFVRSLISGFGVSLSNNPDFIVLRTETFGIDEARELKRLSNQKALAGQKFFLIIPDKITPEAQNALLKSFEDPASNTHFFLALGAGVPVAPTLRSRMNIVRIASQEKISDKAKNFLNLSLRDRLLFAANFAEEKEDLANFLDELILAIKKEGKGRGLGKVYGPRRLVSAENSASRLVLEHLALVL